MVIRKVIVEYKCNGEDTKWKCRTIDLENLQVKVSGEEAKVGMKFTTKCPCGETHEFDVTGKVAS